MNLLLLHAADFVASDVARIADRRLVHVRGVLRKGVGDALEVGAIGGQVGRASIVAMDDRQATLSVRLDRDPPSPLPVTLVLALPRPPVLRRVLAQAASMGVKRIAIIHTARVDNSYWGTPSLQPAAIERELLAGLEQARDTIVPRVELHRRFAAFVDDVLPDMAAGTIGLFAHPEADPVRRPDGPATVVVGPEGGLLDGERDRLAAAGLSGASLGPRALRVETAVVALLARLSP